MSRHAIAALCVMLLAVVLTACGGSSHTAATLQASAIPKAQISVRLESARTPEGAKGAERTRFVEGTPPVTLIGGQIEIDTAGAGLIERFEEVQKAVYCPYWDAYGRVWTRGFGETDWSGNFGGRCITHAQAVNNLIYLVDHNYLGVIRGLRINLSHHEIAALASFVWNLGPGIISGTIREDLVHYRFQAAWAIMVGYVHAGGVVLQGLVTRRYAERAYFFTADPKPKPLTASQRRAITGRIAVLRRVLGKYGCARRQAHHLKLGPTCVRWASEGNRLHHALKVNHL